MSPGGHLIRNYVAAIDQVLVNCEAAARDSETAASRIDDVHLFVHLFVCRQNAKNAIFSKTKQFRAMVSIDDL